MGQASEAFDPDDDDPETVDALIEQRDYWRGEADRWRAEATGDKPVTCPPVVDNVILTADRILVGHCPSPECGPFGGRAIAVLNHHESWPLVTCPCGWVGATDELVNRVRLDRGWKVSDGVGPERELRP